MNSQPFNETQAKDWAKFWESDIGKLYLERLENTKQLILGEIMTCTDKEALSNLAGRAAGVELIMQDILAGVEAGKDKKEVTAKKSYK